MEVVLGLFVLWSWPFWAAIIITFLILFFTVEQYIERDKTLKGQIAKPLSVLLIMFTLVIWANNPSGLWHNITQHYVSYIVGFVVYLVVGSLWSFNRWRMTVNIAVERYKEYMSNLINSTNRYYHRSGIEDFKPDIDKWKVSIMSWIIFWPVSILRYLFGSFLIDFFEGIFNRLKGIYQRINDRRFAKVASLEAELESALTIREQEAENSRIKKS